MNEELIELLSQSDNLDAAFTIGENINNVKNYMINNVFLPQLSTVCKDLNLINESTEYNRVSTSWSGFTVRNPEWKTFKIGFEFEAKGLRNFIIGINHIDLNVSNEKTFNALKSKFWKNNNNWVWNGFPKYINWEKESMVAIQNGEMASLFKIEIEKLLELTKGLEM